MSRLAIPCPRCCDLNAARNDRCRSCDALLRLDPLPRPAFTRCIYCGRRTRETSACPAHRDLVRLEMVS